MDAQKRELTAFGVQKLFIENEGPHGSRPVLDQAMALVREGDVLAVARPDRLCDKPTRLLSIAAALTKRNVGLVVLNIGGQRLDTRLPAAAMQLGMIAGMLRWERAITREGQAVGIAAALARGYVYPGRQPKISPAMVRELASQGLGPTRIAQLLECSRASVNRLLPSGYRAPRKPARVPRERLDPRTIQTLLRTMKGPTAVACGLGCSRSSVYRLRDVAAERWR